MSFKSLKEIETLSVSQQKPFWKIILEDECDERMMSEQEAFALMQSMYHHMKQADEGYDKSLCSASGLVGKDGEKIAQAIAKDKLISGMFMSKVMEKAVKMGESNACMKKIVAAPTAGACGVLPAVLLTYQEQYECREDMLVEALFVAAGIGEVLAARAYISGAAGGCQAEIGSASAMAAGAIVHLRGGSALQITHAAAMALKNLLGLVCDPVAGLVEVPCVKRNVVGAVNAVTCADMAVAGITSRIPPDEVIDAMREVGDAMVAKLRETGEGGLGNTPTGQEIVKQLRAVTREQG